MSSSMIPIIPDVFLTAVLSLVLSHWHSDPEAVSYIIYPDASLSRRTKYSLPPTLPNFTRIVVVSDTHDRHDRLKFIPECDLFIHCGDILMTSRRFSHSTSLRRLKEFNNWLGTISAKEKVVIAGNHDHTLLHLGIEKSQEILSNCRYIVNSSLLFEGLRLWATPASTGFSQNKSFQHPEFIEKTLQECPDEVDVLITHGHHETLQEKVKHRLHLCGHNHNSYGIEIRNEEDTENPTISVCAPICNGKFRMRHLPIVIDFPNEMAVNSAICEFKRAQSVQSPTTGNSTPMSYSDHVIKPTGLKKFSVSNFLLRRFQVNKVGPEE